MFWKKNIKLALFFTCFSLFAVAEARADLIIRATVFNSSNVQIDQESLPVPRGDPVPGSSFILFSSTTLTHFSSVSASTIATTGNGETDHGTIINMNYTGPTGIGTSDRLVIEVIGLDYETPISPPEAFISSNASPSVAGLSAGLVKMESGVNNSNATLPGTVGDLSSFLGSTTGTGTMGNASSILNPNPALGNQFDISSKFSFYQVFTFGDFQTTGMGTISSGSTVANLPVPPSLALIFAATPAFAARLWRKRRKATVEM